MQHAASFLIRTQFTASQPKLVSAVVRRFLAIPASSAASERPFSVTGRLVDKRRSRLLPERVESLVFLNRGK